MTQNQNLIGQLVDKGLIQTQRPTSGEWYETLIGQTTAYLKSSNIPAIEEVMSKHFIDWDTSFLRDPAKTIRCNMRGSIRDPH